MSARGLFLRVFAFTGSPSPRILAGVTRRRLLCPYYHAVSDELPPHLAGLYEPRAVKLFEKDLDTLLASFRAIEIAELLQLVREERAPETPVFFLTFDDGLREFHDFAAPILLRKGVPAACFLCTGFLDNEELFFRHKAALLAGALGRRPLASAEASEASKTLAQHGFDRPLNIELLYDVDYARRTVLDALAPLLDVDFSAYLSERKPYMSRDQVSALARQGFVFGAHSVDHPEYAALPLREQLRQTRTSLDAVHADFGQQYRLFSFPFTDTGVRREFFQIMHDPLNPTADLSFGGAGMKRDSVAHHLQRLPMEQGAVSGRRIVAAEYASYALRAVFRRTKIVRV